MADLMRVTGVHGKYALLLLETRVDSVAELRTQTAENLHPALEKKASQLPAVGKPPALSKVEDWIRQAEELEDVVEFD